MKTEYISNDSIRAASISRIASGEFLVVTKTFHVIEDEKIAGQIASGWVNYNGETQNSNQGGLGCH